MSAPADEDLSCMTTAGLNDLTGIAVGTLRAWRARGVGPPSFRLNGVVVYRRSAVLEWIRAGEEEEQRRVTERHRR